MIRAAPVWLRRRLLIRLARRLVRSSYNGSRVLSRVRSWHVADSGAFQKDIAYQVALRMRLDTAQLPKPFQVNAIASRDWTLTSDWHRWQITP